LGAGQIESQPLDASNIDEIYRSLHKNAFTLGHTGHSRRRHQRGQQDSLPIAKPSQQQCERGNVLIITRPPTPAALTSRTLEHQAQVTPVDLHCELIQLHTAISTYAHTSSVTQVTDISRCATWFRSDGSRALQVSARGRC
jgi:hypothetical protein